MMTGGDDSESITINGSSSITHQQQNPSSSFALPVSQVVSTTNQVTTSGGFVKQTANPQLNGLLRSTVNGNKLDHNSEMDSFSLNL